MNAEDRKIVRICGGIAGLKEIVDGGHRFDYPLMAKLYKIYQHEMPYGTQKARTGDPEVFILKELDKVYDRVKFKSKGGAHINVRVDLGSMDVDSFALLQQQKLKLIFVSNNKLTTTPATKNLLDGLVNFIDHIQDQCVDSGQVPETVVFPNHVRRTKK